MTAHGFMFDFDVAVIGLGPAGSTLARLLSPSLRVLALDKKRFGEDGFQKPCGGLLSSDAQKALAGFDISLPKEVLVDPQIFAVKTMDLKNHLTRYYQRFYINLDRHKFDLWLEAMIPEQIERHSDCLCTAVEREKGGFAISYLENGKKYRVSSRFLVGADGANSLVRRSFYPEKKIRRYLSIQQWFPETHANPFYSCIFDPETTDCCAWSISKDRQFIFGGAFPPDNSRQRFELLKKKLEKEGFRFGEPLKTEACLVMRPSSLRSFCCGDGGVFLIGEAAGFISPSSLEGISWATRSAKALGEVLNGGISGGGADGAAFDKVKLLHRRYRRRTLSLRGKLVGKVLKCPFMYWSFLRKWVMKSGLQAIPMVSAAGKVGGSKD